MFNAVLLDISVAAGSPIHQYILLGGMLLIFYFFMIRPQQRRRKEQRNFLERIKKGEQIVTIGGIHGKVYAVAEDTLTLEIDNKGSKITVAKSAVSLEFTRQYMDKS